MALIYKPKGAAGEYARYAVNFYNGCSNGCTYCFNKRGLAMKLLGNDIPIPKKGYESWSSMFESFKVEVLKMKNELREHGIFMSFTTDPLISGTSLATLTATNFLSKNLIHTFILTKGSLAPSFLNVVKVWDIKQREYIHFGVTLTGYDDMEPNALPNLGRIGLLREATELGMSSFVSLEPIIDLKKSLNMVNLAKYWTDEIRIGLLTPVRYANYTLSDVMDFIWQMQWFQKKYKFRIMWKESFRKLCRKYNIEYMLKF